MGRIGILKEFFQFLKDNKRWWLTPIVLVMILLALLLVAAASPLGPAFYAIF